MYLTQTITAGSLNIMSWVFGLVGLVAGIVWLIKAWNGGGPPTNQTGNGDWYFLHDEFGD